MSFYTRKGDDGTTGLLYGGRVSKDSAAPAAFGTVDEAQAFLGLARAETDRGSELDGLLLAVERDLYVLMAELATAEANRAKLTPGASLVTAEMLAGIEAHTDALSARFAMPTEFVLPGQNRLSALLEVARTVVRRAERLALAVAVDGSYVIPYLNRLSSLLWAMARWQEGGAVPARERVLMPISFDLATDVPAGTDVVAVPVYEGPEAATPARAGLDLAFLVAQGFDGRPGQTQAMANGGGTTLLAVGMGRRGAVDADVVRRGAAQAVRAAWRAGSVASALLDAVPEGVDRATAAQALAEGSVLGAYRYGEFKSDPKPCRITAVTVLGDPDETVQDGLDRGARVAEAVAMARDLVNEPARSMTPRRLAQLAVEIAEREGLRVSVMDEVAIAEEGLGGIQGVAAGSDEPPRLIELVYDPPGARATVAIVGKGITFDSGGLSIKMAEPMMTMKTDMSGAAAVLGIMSALPTLAPDVKVIGLAACSENMPSGRATKPGDVLTIRNGKTVEVLNTDAEGRLVLADALSLAAEAQPDAIIDLATLTGACSVALGREIAGIMGNHDGLVEQVKAASTRAGEPMWHLPLPDRYRKHIDSDIADMKNTGASGRAAGTLSAGLFLQEFVGDRPWVHLDIAGPARAEADDGHLSKGATGVGVRTVLELLATFEKPAVSP